MLIYLILETMKEPAGVSDHGRRLRGVQLDCRNRSGVGTRHHVKGLSLRLSEG